MKTAIPFVALLLLGLSARGGEPIVTSIPFSDQAKPGSVHVWVSQGRVAIRGDASLTSSVTIQSNIVAENSPTRRPDGLRVVSAAASFAATEKDNVVSVDYGRDTVPSGKGASFEIRVPLSTNVVVNTAFGGDVDIKDIQGDVEVKNLNGPIRLAGLNGGALIESMNGEIEASFAKLPAEKPLSFTSMNGEILLRLPPAAGANVRFRTQNGSILTDFDENALKTKAEPMATTLSRKEYTRVAAEAGEAARAAAVDAARAMAETARATAAEVREQVQAATRSEAGAVNVERSGRIAPRAPRPPRPPSIPAMAGGKVVSGTLNGGGPEIQVATMNGDIIVRKLD
ncbi:MAG: hypothetical protein JNN01_23865 [Opitutaceae bacterium]|nr:hypothetical protein [Opitutaceae bacterium]